MPKALLACKLSAAIICGVFSCGGLLRAQPSAQNSAPTGETQFRVHKEYNVLIPMRDGVRLATHIYRPEAKGRFPVIVSRTPYGKDSKSIFSQAEFFAQHGYAYVTQDVRGRYDSQGEFTVLAHEAQDGYDTIEWLARQPWSNGSVGTFGGSYLSWDQWLAAEQQPPHLKAMVVQSTPPDIFQVAWRGAFFINSLFWCLLLDGHTNQDLSVYKEDFTNHLPVSTLDEAAGRHMEKTFRAWTQHDSLDDFWKPQSYEDNLARVNVPVLHLDGWYDMRDVSATLKNYNRMLHETRSAAARQGQRVVIGPWEHGGYDAQKIGDINFGAEAVLDRKGLFLQWYDCFLQNKNCDLITKITPVKVFVLGENKWRDEQEWPPKRARANDAVLFP